MLTGIDLSFSQRGSRKRLYKRRPFTPSRSPIARIMSSLNWRFDGVNDRALACDAQTCGNFRSNPCQTPSSLRCEISQMIHSSAICSNNDNPSGVRPPFLNGKLPPATPTLYCQIGRTRFGKRPQLVDYSNRYRKQLPNNRMAMSLMTVCMLPSVFQRQACPF